MKINVILRLILLHFLICVLSISCHKNDDDAKLLLLIVHKLNPLTLW